MAATVDSTVGGAAANSYVSVAEATSYLETRLTDSSWTSATTDQKNRAVISATRILDDYIVWSGQKTTQEQALRWPRVGMLDRDGFFIESTVVPTDVKQATAELASALLLADREKDSDSRGITSLDVGPIALSFDKNDRTAVVPDNVFAIISHYGTRKRYDGSGRSLTVTRA